MSQESTKDLIWLHSRTQTALLERALEQVQTAANEAIRLRQRFRIVLAGGSTPKGLYEALRNIPTDWSAWEVHFSDERCLPENHPDRNDSMAREALLDHVPIGRICSLPAHRGPDTGAAEACQWLTEPKPFDLTLLGLGEDGHTASLFPQDTHGLDPAAPAAVGVTGAPKPPPERISLSATRLSNSRQVLFLVSGDGKVPALKALRQGASIPASAIKALDQAQILYHTSHSLD